jgi:Skp family chaperone for outer membrane proteins
MKRERHICAVAILVSLAAPLQAAPPATPASAATTPAGKIDADAEIARLQEGLKTSTDAIAAERAKFMTALDAWYVAGLDKLLAERSAAGDLDGALAVKTERTRVSTQGETTAEQLTAMPVPLRAMREAYQAAQKKTGDELARRTAAANSKHVMDLEALQKRITMTGDIEQALKVKSIREDFLKSSPPAAPLASAPVASAPPPATPPAPAPAKAAEYLTKFNPEHLENPVVLVRGSRITTTTSFKPPVEITVRAKTEDTNLRLGYAADQIIFNWEGNRTEFRIDGGPGGGKHQKGAGGIPKNTFVTIRWRVTPEKQSVFVDDRLRFEHEGDYSKIDKPVVIMAPNSKVTVQSLKVQPLPPGSK